MAIKVGLENNILKVDDGVTIQYHNSAWCDMDFTSDSVVIRNWGVNPTSQNLTSYSTILFTEFEDLVGGTYTTEATIATYLSDKIG